MLNEMLPVTLNILLIFHNIYVEHTVLQIQIEERSWISGEPFAMILQSLAIMRFFQILT